ncbi:MAG: tetratricopeptide repeat protein [Promethearchaeota archaeon]
MNFLVEEKYIENLTLEEFSSTIDSFQNLEDLYNLALAIKNFEDKSFREKIILILDYLVDHNQKDIILLENIADLYNELKKSFEAIKVLEKILEINPKKAMIWTKIGIINRDIGDTAAAIKAFNNSLLIDRHNKVTWDYLKWVIKYITSIGMRHKYIKERYIKDMPDWIKKELKLFFY